MIRLLYHYASPFLYSVRNSIFPPCTALLPLLLKSSHPGSHRKNSFQCVHSFTIYSHSPEEGKNAFRTLPVPLSVGRVRVRSCQARPLGFVAAEDSQSLFQPLN